MLTTDRLQHPDIPSQCALMRRTDEELLVGFRESGNEQLFAELVVRYRRPILAYLRGFLRNAEMAEDVAQLVFLKLFRKADQFQDGSRFRPWLYRIAMNQAIDAQRREKRHQAASLHEADRSCDGEQALLDLLVSAEHDPAALAEQRDEIRFTWRRVEKLPFAMQQAMHLAFDQGLKYREIAAHLDIPLGTVKSRVHGALKRLKESLVEPTAAEAA